MVDAAGLTAVSDVVLGLVIAVPVLVVGGGVAVATRRRGRTAPTSAPAPETAPAAPAAVATETVAPEAAPTEAAPTEAPPDGASATTAPEAEALAPATYQGRLGKARGLLSTYLGAVRAKGRIDAATWDDLEEALIRADVGVGATDVLLDDLRARVKAGEIAGPDALVDALKDDLVAMLTADAPPLVSAPLPGEPTPTRPARSMSGSSWG